MPFESQENFITVLNIMNTTLGVVAQACNNVLSYFPGASDIKGVSALCGFFDWNCYEGHVMCGGNLVLQVGTNVIDNGAASGWTLGHLVDCFTPEGVYGWFLQGLNQTTAGQPVPLCGSSSPAWQGAMATMQMVPHNFANFTNSVCTYTQNAYLFEFNKCITLSSQIKDFVPIIASVIAVGGALFFAAAIYARCSANRSSGHRYQNFGSDGSGFFAGVCTNLGCVVQGAVELLGCIFDFTRHR